MSDSGSDLVPAYVLHRYAYRDTSLIVELLTLSHGRLGVVARGARGPRSRWRALLEPFQPLLASWRGRGELATLSGVEASGTPRPLPGPRLASGFYVNELVLRLCRRHDPSTEVFAAYGAVLEDLVTAAAEGPALRVFEKRLLEALGYGLLLEREADSGHLLVAEHRYRYLPDHGPVAVDAGAAGGPEVFSGRALLALHAERIDDDEVAGELRRLMRLVLTPHLGDRPLESRGLYRMLRGDGAKPT